MSKTQKQILIILAKPANRDSGMGLTELTAILKLPRRQVFKALKKLFINDKIYQKHREYYIVT